MRFRRTRKLVCSLPGAVPIACVLFLLLFYMITNSALLLVEGKPLVRLPETEGQRPEGFADSVVVAMDSQQRLFFRNQKIELNQLQAELKKLAEKTGKSGLLLVLKADRSVSHGQLMEIATIARTAGVAETWLATRPRLFDQAEEE